MQRFQQHLISRSSSLDDSKDVDGFKITSKFLPYTPLGIINFLKDNNIEIAGINKNENGKLCSDCDYENLLNKCEYISPVPGGVGLLTRLTLLKNTLNSI